MLVRRAGALTRGPGSGFDMRAATRSGALLAGDPDRAVAGTSAAGAEVGVRWPRTSQPPMSRAPIIAAATPILAARPMRPRCGAAEIGGGLAVAAGAITAT